MSARQLVVLAIVAAGLIVAALVWNRRQQLDPEQARALVFSELAQRQFTLDNLRLLGAGNRPLVTLQKRRGVWLVHERNDYPADAGKVGGSLFALAQTHLQEAKTADAAHYPRIGVEALSSPQAQGMQLRLEGGGPTLRLLIGHAHVNFDGDYLRVNDGAQAWLSDRHLDLSRDPVDWLDHHLIDRPLARIAQVQVESADSPGYTLVHRDDRFRLADLPSAAMGESHAGDALAGFLDQLSFDDVAVDDGKAVVERRVNFVGVDGVQIEVMAWRVQGKVWVRCQATLDEKRANDWLAETSAEKSQQPVAAMARLRSQVALWQSRFTGNRFLLPAFKAAILLMGHSQILKGEQ